MSRRATILERLFTARAEGTLAVTLRDLVDRYSRLNHVTYPEVLRRLGQAAGIRPGTVRQIIRGEIKNPPDRRLEGFASVLADVTVPNPRNGHPVNAPIDINVPSSFSEVWEDLRKVIGNGLELESLSGGSRQTFRCDSDGITVAADGRTEVLSREQLEVAWRLLSAGPVAEQELPWSDGLRSSAVMTLFSALPYIDFTVQPRPAIFLLSSAFTNAELSKTFDVKPQGGIRYAGSANQPKWIVFITGASNEAQNKGNGAGKDHPYHDRWENGTLYYTGEGQTDDQTLTKGNLALHMSSEVKCPVYGFLKKAPNQYEYLGRFRVVGTETEHQIDSMGKVRKVYVFRMKPEKKAAKSSAQTWLCQANPSIFDLSGAIAELDELTYLVNQFTDEIRVGDKVYLWEARGNTQTEPGIVGVAHVIAEVQPIAMDPQELQFARDPERLNGVQPRIRLKVDRVLPARIKRSELEEHPVLRDLPVIRFPQQTTYRLTPEHAMALAELIGENQGENQTQSTQDGVNAEARPMQGVRSAIVAGHLEFVVATLPPIWNWPEQMDRLIRRIDSTGFIFEPWQVAAYLTALRTKPFVILAGISGTGKSRLPQLVASACGYECEVVPVRPDWTDSSELLGYTDLQNTFRSRPFLEIAERAGQQPDQGFVVVLDEMNLARVEHYFAEVLSRIEDRRREGNRWFCKPLISGGLNRSGDSGFERWLRVGLPPNLSIVGTVNMDESTHGFSRKVLDRAFTLELSDVQLNQWGRSGLASENGSTSLNWPASVMIPQYTSLADVTDPSPAQRAAVDQVVSVLGRLNDELKAAQLQVGYRVRDEIALFVIHAADVAGSFVTRSGERVDPLDLAIAMKILPRIIGGSGAIRRVLKGVLAWATGRDRIDDGDADALVDRWREAGRPSALAGHAFPRCTARLCLMWERLMDDGFTSYWL